jgi:hypothetical protein
MRPEKRMSEKRCATWGSVLGALAGLTLTGVAALVLDGDSSAGILVFAIVAITPTFAGLGAILGLDAAAVLGPRRVERTPRLTADTERVVRERFGERLQSTATDGIQTEA